MIFPSDEVDEQAEVQDNRREDQMRTLFGLKKRVGAGRIDEDAIDEFGNPFELKSATKGGVSSARDVGPHTLEKWRKLYWIFAKGTNTKKEGFIIREVYFLSPTMLNEWIDQLESKNFGPDLKLLEEAKAALAKGNFVKAAIDRISYLVKRGLTLNNPHIPWWYIQSHGIKFDLDKDPRAQLRDFVKRHPLTQPLPPPGP